MLFGQDEIDDILITRLGTIISPQMDYLSVDFKNKPSQPPAKFADDEGGDEGDEDGGDDDDDILFGLGESTNWNKPLEAKIFTDHFSKPPSQYSDSPTEHDQTNFFESTSLRKASTATTDSEHQPVRRKSTNFSWDSSESEEESHPPITPPKPIPTENIPPVTPTSSQSAPPPVVPPESSTPSHRNVATSDATKLDEQTEANVRRLHNTFCSIVYLSNIIYLLDSSSSESMDTWKEYRFIVNDPS